MTVVQAIQTDIGRVDAGYQITVHRVDPLVGSRSSSRLLVISKVVLIWVFSARINLISGITSSCSDFP
jgi:hypothetical protein